LQQAERELRKRDPIVPWGGRLRNKKGGNRVQTGDTSWTKSAPNPCKRCEWQKTINGPVALQTEAEGWEETFNC